MASEIGYGRRMLLVTISLLALAALPSGGKAVGDAAHWLHAADFPSTEWLKAAVTQYDLMTDDGGRPTLCVVTATSGSPTVDNVACNSLMKRARYTPARDASGQALPQAIRGRLEWHPDSTAQNEHRVTADLSVATPLLPPNARNVSVKIVLIYNRSGAIEQCTVVVPGQPAGINQEACQLASRPGLFPSVKDSTGEPVRGLREIEVIHSPGRQLKVEVL